jgi:hypothetical protein
MAKTSMARIDAMFNSMTDKLSYLYARWLDEREYEGINDAEEHNMSNFVLIKQDAEDASAIFSVTGPFLSIDAAKKGAEFLENEELEWSKDDCAVVNCTTYTVYELDAIN